MYKVLFLSLFSFFLFGSCDSNRHAAYMAFDNVRYVKGFPHSYSLDNDQLVEWDIIGMKSFCFFDSLLVVTTTDNSGLWYFLSSKDYRFLGKFLRRGGGPGEFVGCPRDDDALFYYENNQIYSDIYDFQSGKLYKLNVTNTLDRQGLDISIKNDSLPSFLFDRAIINDSTVYCKEIANEERQQIRFLWKNGKKRVPTHFEQLNSVAVENRENFNILSTITRKSPTSDLIVEVPINLDQINLFSATDSFGLTICPNKEKLDKIGTIEDKIRWNRTYTYGGLRTYKDFFAALYINENELRFQTGRKTYPEIQLFDWDGNPLAKIKINQFATHFDFDFQNHYLYVLNSATDEFYKYDIRDILKQLPN